MITKADKNKRLFHYRDVARILTMMEDSLEQSDPDNDPDFYFFGYCWWLLNGTARRYQRIYPRLYAVSRKDFGFTRNLPRWARDFDQFVNRWIEDQTKSAFEGLITVLLEVLSTGNFQLLIDYILGNYVKDEEE